MKLVFMGSGAFALPSLEALLASTHRVDALFTQPDKPAGRGHGLRSPSTKALALRHGISVHQPPKLRAPESIELVRSLAPECIVVVAYGQIVPKAVLDIPPKGIINVHGSLLPAYRGAAPIQWAIARGETRTGVTTMLMDEGLDTGPVLLREAVPIGPDDTSATLGAVLARVGAKLLLDTLRRWERGTLEPEPQDDHRATKAPRIKVEDARIDWSRDATEISCRVRAFDPWPVAFTSIDGTQVKIWKARPVSGDGSGTPGSIVRYEGTGLVVACGRASHLLLQEVQAEGKKRISAADFARGRRLVPGSRFAADPAQP